MTSNCIYLMTFIPVMALCGKLRFFHYSDSSIKPQNSILLNNRRDNGPLKDELISSLPEHEESHKMLGQKTTPLFNIPYRTTAPHAPSFDNSFMNHLGFSLGLESYPTLPYFPEFKTNLFTYLRSLISDFYNSTFKIFSILEEQVGSNKSFDVYHLSDAYF